MSNAPSYTKTATVFDCSVLYRGRPVKLAGYDSDGEPLRGNWLIANGEYEKIILVYAIGRRLSIFIDEVIGPDATITIIPYPEVDSNDG